MTRLFVKNMIQQYSNYLEHHSAIMVISQGAYSRILKMKKVLFISIVTLTIIFVYSTSLSAQSFTQCFNNPASCSKQIQKIETLKNERDSTSAEEIRRLKAEDVRQRKTELPRANAKATAAALKAIADADADAKAKAAALAAAKAKRLADPLKTSFNGLSIANRKEIQSRLAERGFYKSRVDGVYGAGTRRSLNAYAESINAVDHDNEDGSAGFLAQVLKLQQLATNEPPKVEPTALAPTATVGDLSDPVYAQQVLDDIREFGTLNPGVLDPITIGSLYIPSLQELKKGTFKKKSSSFMRLAVAVRSNDDFAAYHAAKMDKRLASIEVERQEIARSLDKALSDARAKIAANPFSAEAPKLAAIVERFSSISADAPLGVLKKTLASLKTDLSKLGMSVASAPSGTASSVKAQPIKTSTANLDQLSDVGSEDAVLLVNLGGDAPNAFRDLSGKPAFEKRNVIVCAPALATLKGKHRTFVQNALATAMPDHSIKMQTECAKGYAGTDVVLATGANFARGDKLPAAHETANRLKTNKLVRITTIKQSDFIRELAKRDIISSQYKADIEQGARLGFGAISFGNKSAVACVAEITDHTAHDRALQQSTRARQFEDGVSTKEILSVSVTEAFKQAQRGNCGFIYGSAATLKKLLQASATAGLSANVLPVWATPGSIEQRAQQLSSENQESQQAEGQRRAELQSRQVEAEAARKAEAEQLENKQKQYRKQYGAKVASLVSKIDQQLADVRSEIDASIASARGLDTAVSNASFWSPYPSWYSGQRKKGWMFESTIPTPKDYGSATWKNRQVEAVIADIKMLMKNPDLGEYAVTCWTAGYINDTEFKRLREPFVAKCDDKKAFDAWRGQHAFETKWELGVQ